MEKLSANWVRYALASYLKGRGASWGCGGDRIVPLQALDSGRYSLTLDYQKVPNTDIVDGDYSIIANGSLEHLFVGPRLGALTNADEVLAALVPKLAQDGHLLVHIPSDRYSLEQVREMLAALGGWQEKDTYEREGQVAGCWKLVAPRQREVRPPKPKPAKRALVSRYGAIGDAIIMTPLLRKLKEDGYHVTVNCTPYAAEVFSHNPHVDEIVIQERDVIPNAELGPYWNFWKERYDRYINLSESIEGSILRVEGRRDFFTTSDWRQRTGGGTNYYQNTLELGGYLGDGPVRGELYFNSAERRAARYVRERFLGKKLVLWGLKGSSYHKQYPLLKPFLEQWLPQHPEVQILFCGAEQDRELGWDGFQTMNVAGQMPLREVFALAEVADLVVGPESSLINAAGCFQTPKVVLRSHSTCQNLCAGFENHICLSPSTACHPCLQLHYSEGSCPLVTIQDTATEAVVWKGPACCAGVSPERLGGALDQALALRAK